jgi:hypothetical protein
MRGRDVVLRHPPPEIDQRVYRASLSSQVLGVPKAFYVYLPPSYPGTERRFPVLYLLRGHEREWVHPAEDGSRHGTVIDVYLHLLEQRRVGEMILVFPGLTSAWDLSVGERTFARCASVKGGMTGGRSLRRPF